MLSLDNSVVQLVLISFLFLLQTFSSHWFLAVICYPGLIGCRSMEDDSEVAMPETSTATTTTSAVNSKSGNKGGENEESKQKKKVMTIGSTSIIPLKGADVSM